jgi:Heterokaryon incompatibility protein (HET)
MRLINTHTLKLEEFVKGGPFDGLQYIILSHTWGKDEISFEEFQYGRTNAKIRQTCAQARREGFRYVWIDTCCIDKRSSAELSEAINSMYKWYQWASICYVFLEDCPSIEILREDPAHLWECRWFSRGWTLQELIAPKIVEFYNPSWIEIGTKSSLRELIARRTNIPEDVLTGFKRPKEYNVAVRLGWAARRYTTRVEDSAYCLMGLFGIHLPLLYGEGKSAFQRLQEEILRVEEDYSLFVHRGSFGLNYVFATTANDFTDDRPGGVDYRFEDLVALPPELFNRRDSGNTIRPLKSSVFERSVSPHDDLGVNFSPPSMTSRGVRLSVPLMRIEGQSSNQVFAAFCGFRHEMIKFRASKHHEDAELFGLIGRILKVYDRELHIFRPATSAPLVHSFSYGDLKRFSVESIYLSTDKVEGWDGLAKFSFTVISRSNLLTHLKTHAFDDQGNEHVSRETSTVSSKVAGIRLSLRALHANSPDFVLVFGCDDGLIWMHSLLVTPPVNIMKFAPAAETQRVSTVDRLSSRIPDSDHWLSVIAKPKYEPSGGWAVHRSWNLYLEVSPREPPSLSKPT